MCIGLTPNLLWGIPTPMETEQEVISKDAAFEARINRFRLHFLVAVGEYIQLIVATVRATFWRPPKLHLIMKQMYNIGVGSLTVVAITGFHKFSLSS